MNKDTQYKKRNSIAPFNQSENELNHRVWIIVLQLLQSVDSQPIGFSPIICNHDHNANGHGNSGHEYASANETKPCNRPNIQNIIKYPTRGIPHSPSGNYLRKTFVFGKKSSITYLQRRKK